MTVTDAELTLARICEVLRDPDLYDSYNSVTTRCLVRDIKVAMGLPLDGTHVDSRLGSDNYMRAAAAIATEAAEARQRFPAFNSAHEGYAVIAEELDELWDDVKADNVEHAIAEAVQVGAMALRFIADMREKLAEAAIK
jgi:hypothetical protein